MELRDLHGLLPLVRGLVQLVHEVVAPALPIQLLRILLKMGQCVSALGLPDSGPRGQQHHTPLQHSVLQRRPGRLGAALHAGEEIPLAAASCEQGADSGVCPPPPRLVP